MRVDTSINIGDTVLWRGKERIVRSVKVIVKRNIDWERTEVIFYKVIGSKVWAREDELTYVHGFRTKPMPATISDVYAENGVGFAVLRLEDGPSVNPKDAIITCQVPEDSPLWRQLTGHDAPSITSANVWVEWRTDDTDKHHRYRTIAKIEKV